MILTDSRQLDWPTVERAAKAILKKCEDSGFTAPEDLPRHRMHIVEVCAQINVIAKALCCSMPGAK